MNKFFSVLLTAVVFAGAMTFSSCKKEDFSVFAYMDGVLITVPAQSIVSATGIDETFEVPISLIEDACDAAGVPFDPSKVTEAKLKGLKATVTGGNFDDLSGINVFVKAPSDSGDGTQVAYIGSSTGATELTFDLNGADIKSLLANDKMVFTVRSWNNKNNSPAISFNLNSGYIDFRVARK